MKTEVELRVVPEVAADPEKIRQAAASKTGIKTNRINAIRVVRRSIDARQRQVMVNLTVRIATDQDTVLDEPFTPHTFKHVTADSPSLIIIGAGPAGLFAALQALELGIRPIVLERGLDVDARRVDIANISRERRINPRSNYCYGEGGAGAYSDGKLYTRSKKRGNVRAVLELLVQHGASPDILVDAHPHVGSDKLPGVIKAIRQTIIDHGGEVKFDTKVTSIIIEEGRASGVTAETSDGEKRIDGDGVILATGHSARDTIRMLDTVGIPLEAKGIAVGVRLEHPQELIDQLQYHNPRGRGKYLPAAEYNYVTQVDGRGVYSFCMCPGGVIVPAGSTDGELVVNGMSASARAGRNANSGMVVEIRPGDIDGYQDRGAFELLDFQEDLERSFYHAAGDSIVAPAQLMTDFVAGRESRQLLATSYAPGVQPRDFNKLFPTFISTRLRRGFEDFGKKCRGFLTDRAMLVGLESRTSSPVRVTRHPDTLESTGVSRLYPAGEGAGYAGGIVSAAIDGMRCAESFASTLTQ